MDDSRLPKNYVIRYFTKKIPRMIFIMQQQIVIFYYRNGIGTVNTPKKINSDCLLKKMMHQSF